MAVEQATCTLSPIQFSADAEFTAEDAQAVIKQMNWSAGKRPVCHLATDCHSKALVASVKTVRRGIIFTEPDVQTITVGAICTLVSGQTCDVTFIIDGASKTISFAFADSGTEKTATFDVASDLTGANGDLSFTITGQRTAGSGSPTLDTVRIQEGEIAAADLPAPANS